jgi:hypothetical protein
MAIDPATLDSTTPRTTDGREYPEYLRVYEQYDRELLSLIGGLPDPTANEFALAVPDPKLRSVVSRWLASAEWRGLVERHDGDTMVSRRTYWLTDRGRARQHELS